MEIEMEAKIYMNTNLSLEYLNSVSFGECLSNGTYKEIHKYDESVRVVRGIEYPANTKSAHMKIDILSKKMRNVQSRLLKTMRLFHDFAEHNNILYTLTGANLLSYARDNTVMLPWDDDVDIVTDAKSFQVIQNWFKLAEPMETIVNSWKLRKFMYRDIPVIFMHDDELFNWMIKIVVNDGSEGIFDTRDGTVDIFNCDYSRKAPHYMESKRKACGGLIFDGISIGPKLTESEREFPVVDMCGIKVRCPSKEVAIREWLIPYWGIESLKKRHLKYQKYP